MRRSARITWLRDLASTTLAFDRSSVEPGYALRCTVGVAIPLLLGATFHRLDYGVPAAIGAFIAGFTSQQGVYRTRLVAIMAAAAGMAAASFFGSLAAHSTFAIVLVSAAAGYVYAVIAQYGPAASTAGLNSLVVFVVFSSEPLALGADLHQSAFVLAGGILQALLLLAAWPFAKLGAERLALARVYDDLARYAQSIASGDAALPPIAPFANARQVFADPQPFARSDDIARLMRLLEDAETIRKLLGSLAGVLAEAGAGQPGHLRAASVSRELRAIGTLLEGRRTPIPAFSPASYDPGGTAVQTLRELDAQVRDAMQAAAMLSGRQLPRLHFSSVPRPGPYVRVHVSWFGRDALRFSIVLAVAMVLARQFSADRGYWIPLTAALVLKPEFRNTFVRGAARIAGTLGGAVVATAVVSLATKPALQAAAVVVAAAVAYLTFNPSYALFTVAITSFVVMVLSLLGLPGVPTIAERVLDTLAGGALAMLAYAIFPTWERKRTRALLADLIDAQRSLSEAILAAYAEPARGSLPDIARWRTAVWKARTSVEASIDRARQEPRGTHTIGTGRAVRILAAAQRLGLANFALEAPVDAGERLSDPAVLMPLRTHVATAFRELAGALRSNGRVERDDALSGEIRRLHDRAAIERSATLQFVADHARGYAEAAVRIARLVGSDPPAPQA